MRGTSLGIKRQEVVAYHESGHAVVARELGLRVDWIERNGDGSGECRISVPGSVYDEAAVYAAGYLAAGFKFGPGVERRSPNDMKGLQRVALPQQMEAIDRAGKILRARWIDVEELALRLLEDPDGFLPSPFPIDSEN